MEKYQSRVELGGRLSGMLARRKKWQTCRMDGGVGKYSEHTGRRLRNKLNGDRYLGLIRGEGFLRHQITQRDRGLLPRRDSGKRRGQHRSLPPEMEFDLTHQGTGQCKVNGQGSRGGESRTRGGNWKKKTEKKKNFL